MRSHHALNGKMRSITIVAALILLALPAGSAHAGAYTINLHIDGMAGMDGQGNWINLMSYQWGAGREIAFPAEGTGENRLAFTRVLDPTTAAFQQAVKTHQTAATADLTVLQTTTETQPPVFLTYHMTNVLITSVSHNGDSTSNNQFPTESVTFAFEALSVNYVPQTGPPETVLWFFPFCVFCAD